LLLPGSGAWKRFAGNRDDDLLVLADEGCQAAGGWQQGWLDAGFSSCGLETAGVDAAAGTDAQPGNPLQDGWTITSMYKADDDCWSLPVAPAGDLTGSASHMEPGIQPQLCERDVWYTSVAGGILQRQAATLAAGSTQLHDMTTGGSGAVVGGVGVQHLQSMVPYGTQGSQPASWTSSTDVVSPSAELSALPAMATAQAPLAAMAARGHSAACSATFSATPAAVVDPSGSSTAAASLCSLTEWLLPESQLPVTSGMQPAVSALPPLLPSSSSPAGHRMPATLPSELRGQQQQGSTPAVTKYVPLSAGVESTSAAVSPFAFGLEHTSTPAALPPIAAGMASSTSMQPAFAASQGMPAAESSVTAPAPGAGSCTLHLQLLQQHLEMQRWQQQQQQASVVAATASQLAGLSLGNSPLIFPTAPGLGQQDGLLQHGQAACCQQQAFQQAQTEAARQDQVLQLEIQARAQAAMQQQLLHQQMQAQQQAEVVRQQLKQDADPAMQQQLRHVHQQAEFSKQQQRHVRRASAAGLHRLSITTYPHVPTQAAVAAGDAAATSTNRPSFNSIIAVSNAQQQLRAAAKSVKKPPPGFDHLPSSTARPAVFSAETATTSSSCNDFDVASLSSDQEASDDQLLALLCC